MSHLERRSNIWYALLTIPRDARESLGKLRFVQSLKTPSKPTAARRAAPLVAKWRAEIDQARGRSNATIDTALAWKEALSAIEGGHHRETLEMLLTDHAEDLERTKGLPAAQAFYNVATGKHTPSTLYFTEWEAQIGSNHKTKEQMVKDVRRMIARFPVLEEISRKDVRKWFLEECKASPSTIERVASFCRHYWRHLKAIHAVPDVAVGPFDRLDLSRASAALSKHNSSSSAPVGAIAPGSWVPFTPQQVVELWTAARERGDGQLANLTALAAYTGARIEEICAAKFADIKDNASLFTSALHIRAAKTTAGIREVPLHSHLKGLMARLKRESTDGYLLSGLTFNKYQDRSNAIGKRFGRLKVSMGHDAQHVFHSIRKTFVTLSENAGIPENVVADIVGHARPTLTFGLYSGGNSIEVKRKAIEKVKYPFPVPL